MSLLNKTINNLPIELHIPGYNYCGPGTKLEKRLAKGDQGINGLDSACKEHDIAYSQSTDLADRHRADKVLADKAWQRFKSKEAKFGERMAALGVTGAMKAKVKMGMGHKKKKKTGKGHKKKKSRAVTIPSTIIHKGGFLPLLLAGLSAIGALAGGGSAIASAVNKAKSDSKQLDEMKKHNSVMEAAALGKGMYLSPYSYYSKNY